MLYRLLHEVFLASGRSEDADLVMVDLLGTFTLENASQTREEAQKCIVYRFVPKIGRVCVNCV